MIEGLVIQLRLRGVSEENIGMFMAGYVSAQIQMPKDQCPYRANGLSAENDQVLNEWAKYWGEGWQAWKDQEGS